MTDSAIFSGTSTSEKRSAIWIEPTSRGLTFASLTMAPTRSPGRAAGVRPGDLVGAIVNEAKVSPRDVGSIQIAERFSLVEVPEKIAESVMRALRGTMIRGQKVVVRRDKDAGR